LQSNAFGQVLESNAMNCTIPPSSQLSGTWQLATCHSACQHRGTAASRRPPAGGKDRPYHDRAGTMPPGRRPGSRRHLWSIAVDPPV